MCRFRSGIGRDARRNRVRRGWIAWRLWVWAARYLLEADGWSTRNRRHAMTTQTCPGQRPLLRAVPGQTSVINSSARLAFPAVSTKMSSMLTFLATAFLAGLLEGLRTAHAVAFVRVSILAPPLLALFGWVSGARDFKVIVMTYLLPGFVMAILATFLGLAILHWRDGAHEKRDL